MHTAIQCLKHREIMAYRIYIHREGRNPISLLEWQTAVQQADGVRLAEGDTECTNPKSGEVIAVSNSGGDAEVFFPSQSKWFHVFSWRNGKVAFKGPSSFDAIDDSVRKAATQLASLLNARIIGDEGEPYE